MAQSTYRKQARKDASDQFFLYVAFHSAWSAIVEFFNNFQLTADDVSWMAYEVSVQKRDPGEVARQWMSENSKTVDGWLGL